MDRLKNIFKLRNIFKGFSIFVSLCLVLSYLSPFVHPESSSIIPLFGLTYPVIIILQFILIIIWLFIKKGWAIALAILVVLGGNLHFRTISIGFEDDVNGATEIKVMSYNVRLFDLYNADPELARENKDKIIKYVVAENPDIVCFQEFYHQDSPSNFVTKDTLLKLLESKDYHERYSQIIRDRSNFGVSIFSKYKMIEKGCISFEEIRPSFNYCIYADIVTPDDTIRVYNVHLQSIRLNIDDYTDIDDGTQTTESSSFLRVIGKIMDAYPIRAKQTDKIVKHIKSSPYPVVVCGDFNDTPMSYAYNQFNKILTDAFRNTSFGIGKTYAGKIPAGRIDYIFHSSEIGSRNFIIQNEVLSDHYAIDCSIFVKRE